MDLGVERSLPFVGDVMDGETRNDCVEASQIRQGCLKVVLKHRYVLVVAKPFPCGT
ncbi:MAG: hypothetical protein OXC19_18310 [Bryobacterales bacterium]|nr:hypothetical protein [Bryobacterales bacterium]